jgi:allantoin racemase
MILLKILIINPNTSSEMSETIDKMARQVSSHGTEITTVNPEDGPAFIANAHQAALQATRVVDLVEKNRMNYDCFVIACGVDPGLEACRIVAKNVVGAGEAAIMTACAVAKRFSFLSPLKGGEASKRERLRLLGIDQTRCASVRVVGSGLDDEIIRKRDERFDLYYEAGRRCVDEDGAGALVLTCAGMCDLEDRLEKLLKIPVFSGVESGVKIAEQLPIV